MVLRHGAELLGSHDGDAGALHEALADLRRAGAAVQRGPLADATSLDPSFRAQEVGFAVAAVAANIELTAAADRRTWPQRILGWQPSGIGSPLDAARERAAAHLEPHSVWLHNSIRAAIGLALAVLVARLTGVEHSFWVVLGALAVLRSNALNTGQTAIHGLTGTFVGIVVGGALVAVIGTNPVVSWVLLPFAILFAGLAPAAISFAAGQAGFSIARFVLFNIIEPTGWKVGIVRIEDVALGCGVSLVVGLLFWPRGAGKALNKALAEAYADSARYLRAAVDFGITRCDAATPPADAPQAQTQRAAAAARRLDDAFRTYIGERGAKPVPLTDVTRLVTGVACLRLAADAVLSLWDGDDGAATGDRTTARQQLQKDGHAVSGWYTTLAVAVAVAVAVAHRPGPRPAPAGHGDDGDAARRRGTRPARRRRRLDGNRGAHGLDGRPPGRRLQPTLIDPARAVARAG